MHEPALGFEDASKVSSEFRSLLFSLLFSETSNSFSTIWKRPAPRDMNLQADPSKPGKARGE
jgi:hypothetical protein